MMSDEQEVLKIEIATEEETPAPPQRHQVLSEVRAGASRAGQEAGRAAQKAWNSPARKAATSSVKTGVQKGVTAVAAKSADLVHEHMVKAAQRQARQQAAHLQTRIQKTDWKAEAGKGAAAGLRWASTQIGRLANRLQRQSTTEER